MQALSLIDLLEEDEAPHGAAQFFHDGKQAPSLDDEEATLKPAKRSSETWKSYLPKVEKSI